MLYDSLWADSVGDTIRSSRSTVPVRLPLRANSLCSPFLRNGRVPSYLILLLCEGACGG